MRVGFDARWYNDSGVGTYVAELLKAMASLDRDFDLLIYEDPENLLPQMDGKSVERIPVSSGKYSLTGQIELAWRCKRDAVDVFHSPFYILPLAAPCTTVMSLHDLIPFLFEIHKEPKQSLVKAGYKVATHRSTHIVTGSKHTAGDVQSILQVPPEKVSVIQYAVSTAHFHANRNADELQYLEERYGIHPPYVLTASARNWRTKNLITAFRALSLASLALQGDFQTVVYGPPEGITALGGWQAWRELKLVPTGYVPVRDLAILFRHAQSFIFPSLYEGFGLPVLEAMSCGCPVITSNAGSLAEVAGEGAQTFDPLDVRGIAEATKMLFCDPGQSKHWREFGLRRARDFSWQKTAEQTISVYHRAHRQLSTQTRSLTSLG
ncbi:MAG: mshA 5 [Acidobacteriales bacterium]|nr:mshA 5 [Terriglobales bacterium]